MNIVNFKGSTASPGEINRYWGKVAERYAQVGVMVEWVLKDKVTKPSGIGNLVNVYGSGGNAASWGLPNKKLSDEFKKIIEDHGTKTGNTDVRVFYVYEMGWESGVVLTGILRGAAPAKTHLDSAQSGYENNILISGRDTGIFTAAHELGHLVLTTNVASSTGTITHLPQTEFRNIMVKSPVHTDDIEGSKRFDEY